MVSGITPDPEDLDEADQRALSAAEREKLVYLDAGYWNEAPKLDDDNSLYYTSIDLKQFFPLLKPEPVLAGLAKANPENDDRVTSLLGRMLEFHVDSSGIPKNLIGNVEPPFPEGKAQGLPTGLHVAGFLANVALTEVDKSVELELKTNRRIAHFRFVDDHTILAYDFDDLCNWITRYEELLEHHKVGPPVNSDKYDPPSLIKWMNASKGDRDDKRDKNDKNSKNDNSDKNERELKEDKEDEEDKEDKTEKKDEVDMLRTEAINDTRVDGKNPTKLMTKTLTQVSAIAADDIHILDDEDLQERLRMLEWLLGANIDEREIRADTRASFATGRIAQLVPTLIEEEKGLVDNARKLAKQREESTDTRKLDDKMLADFQARLENLESEVQTLTKKQIKSERKLLRKYFELLFSAMQKFPGKPRLFFRLLQYCRDTGYGGLFDIGEWIAGIRNSDNQNWANYFSGLGLQILGRNAESSSRILTRQDVLHSSRKAAKEHLQDIADNSVKAFRLEGESQAWFHSVARKEFGVSLLVAAQILEERAELLVVAQTLEERGELLVATQTLEERVELLVATQIPEERDERLVVTQIPEERDELKALASKLSKVAREFSELSTETSHDEWIEKSGRSPGVWALTFEPRNESTDEPSASWRMFSTKFQMTDKCDANAVRWYPESLSEDAWHYLLQSKGRLSGTDWGWVTEALRNDPQRLREAKASGKRVFNRATRLLNPTEKHGTLEKWVEKVSNLSPFDPRASEWTAFEIMRILIARIIGIGPEKANKDLDRLHPLNVLLPVEWAGEEFKSANHAGKPLNWFEWRAFMQNEGEQGVILRKVGSSVGDYRFAGYGQDAMKIDDWQRRLSAVGFILLGLVRKNFNTPRIWNIRGHEKIYRVPRSQWYESLKISSQGLLLIESCLSARSAETRTILKRLPLFGIEDKSKLNDTKYDPPRLESLDELLEAIDKVQETLIENQLSVSLNQPRQLIPFRLRDFSVGAEQGGEDDEEDTTE